MDIHHCSCQSSQATPVTSYQEWPSYYPQLSGVGMGEPISAIVAGVTITIGLLANRKATLENLEDQVRVNRQAILDGVRHVEAMAGRTLPELTYMKTCPDGKKYSGGKCEAHKSGFLFIKHKKKNLEAQLNEQINMLEKLKDMSTGLNRIDNLPATTQNSNFLAQQDDVQASFAPIAIGVLVIGYLAVRLNQKAAA